MRHRWLTPDTAPGGFASRCLFIPDSVDWLAIVAGALFPLVFAHNFEQYGTATPQETADAFAVMFDNFSFNAGVCRVIGEIVWFAGTANPNPGNWLDCDGRSVLRVDYPDLFAVVGTAYGAADSTHFNIPDMRGRAPISTGSGSGLTTRTLGDLIGEETHTITTAESAGHTHIDGGHTHTEITAILAVGAAITGVPVPSATPGIGTTGVGNASLDTVGGNDPHNNIQPSIALNCYIVAL